MADGRLKHAAVSGKKKVKISLMTVLILCTVLMNGCFIAEYDSDEGSTGDINIYDYTEDETEKESQDDVQQNRFATLSDAREYILERTARCEESIVIYLDDLDQLVERDNCVDLVRYITGEYGIEYNWDTTTGRLELKPGYYSGTKILHAVNTGDFSNLTEKEYQTYEVAAAVVNEAVSSTSSDLDLEKYLHDYICTNVSYVNYEYNSTDFSAAPDFRSAAGALVDGLASCQGYTDAFYLLGNMAGFNVRRQDGFDVEDHMWNTIELNGNWYIVDTTHDDNEDLAGSLPASYEWFNAGLDIAGDRTWDMETETAKVADYTDYSLYYYDCGYGVSAYDMDSLVDYMVSAWTNNRRNIVYGMLNGQEQDISAFDAAVNSYAASHGIAMRWTSVAIMDNGNTFCQLVMSEN